MCFIFNSFSFFQKMAQKIRFMSLKHLMSHVTCTSKCIQNRFFTSLVSYFWKAKTILSKIQTLNCGSLRDRPRFVNAAQIDNPPQVQSGRDAVRWLVRRRRAICLYLELPCFRSGTDREGGVHQVKINWICYLRCHISSSFPCNFIFKIQFPVEALRHVYSPNTRKVAANRNEKINGSLNLLCREVQGEVSVFYVSLIEWCLQWIVLVLLFIFLLFRWVLCNSCSCNELWCSLKKHLPDFLPVPHLW